MTHSSINIRKQSGFTLVELMVVMAIIAILTTAGLSAYTGYIKKARDTKRIVDVSTIDMIIMSWISITGKPPLLTSTVYTNIINNNNDKMIYDPIDPTWVGWKKVCLDTTWSLSLKECYYTYRVCDGGNGYAIGTRFESPSNRQLYANDDIIQTHVDYPDNTLYEIGRCKVTCDPSILGCPTTNSPAYNYAPTKINVWGDSLLEPPTNSNEIE